MSGGVHILHRVIIAVGIPVQAAGITQVSGIAVLLGETAKLRGIVPRLEVV